MTQDEMNEVMDRSMTIDVLVREQYGKRVFKPKCAKALRFAAIAGSVTLTERVLRNIMELGYKINFLHEQVYLRKADIDPSQFKL